jgi:hypothetical protein
VANAEEAVYHRSYLSPDYLDNFRQFDQAALARRRAEDVDAIRERDPNAFEDRRQSLAQMLRVPYRPGYMQVYPGDQGGRDHWVTGIPSDAEVAECMEPLYPSQKTVMSPTTGMVALPFPGVTRQALVSGKGLIPVRMCEKLDQEFATYATGYVTLSAVATEGAVATVGYGGTVYGLYYWANKGCGDTASSPPTRSGPAGAGLPVK